MDKPELMNKYTELHGYLMNQKPGLLDKLNNLLIQMDQEGLTDKRSRETRRIQLFEKELGPSQELTELKNIVSALLDLPEKSRRSN